MKRHKSATAEFQFGNIEKFICRTMHEFGIISINMLLLVQCTWYQRICSSFFFSKDVAWQTGFSKVLQNDVKYETRFYSIYYYDRSNVQWKCDFVQKVVFA